MSKIEAKIAGRSTNPVALSPATAATRQEAVGNGSLAEIFSPFYRLRTMTLWVIWITASTIGYGMLVWLPTIFRTIYKLPLEDVLRFATLSGFGILIGAILGIVVIDRIGRRPIFIFAFGATTAALLTLWFLTRDQTMSVNIIFVLAIVGTSATAMAQVALWGYTSESYPTRIRAFATGTASVWGRVATLIMPFVVGFLLSSFGVGSIYLAFGLTALVSGLVVLLFALETRGRRLEELSP